MDDITNRTAGNVFHQAGAYREEYDRRRELARQYEAEKLAWGRGFFSYEICDLEVYSDIYGDRRNCRIATPGALIQDEVSFVFGSALRQMENADEFEEWVAPNTLAVLNDTLNWNGLACRSRAKADRYCSPLPCVTAWQAPSRSP